jgi:ribosomal protein S24E
MNIAIIKKDENRLFHRVEVVARVEHKGGATPKRRELRDAIGKELKSKPEFIVIKVVRNLYGVPHSLVEANVYSKEDKMKECEPEYVLVRNSIIKKKEVEKEEKETKEEEEPKEEVKEVGKEEEGSEGKGKEGEEKEESK